jgi:hypothetical protein
MLNLFKSRILITALCIFSASSHALAQNRIGPFWGDPYPSNYRYKAANIYLDAPKKNKLSRYCKGSKHNYIYKISPVN